MFPFGGSSDPKKMNEMLQRMGVKSKEIEALEVIIMQKGGKKLVIRNPQVMEIEFSGKRTFQIFGEVSVQDGAVRGKTGEMRERGDEGDEEIVVSDKDVKFVADAARMPEKKAREVLIKTKGDIAKAILILKK